MPRPTEHLARQEALTTAALCLGKRFIGRWDMYPRQREDGSYVTVREPLTVQHLMAHLAGTVTLGAYALDERSQGRFLVLDADDPHTWASLGRLARSLLDEDIPSYLEASRRGGHQWFFLKRPAAGLAIRAFAEGLLARHRLGGVEVYPKQASLATGPGSLIRLPFGVHRKSGLRYGFADARGQPLGQSIRDQMQALLAAQSVPETALSWYGRLGHYLRAKAPKPAPQPVRTPSREANPEAPVSERVKAAISVREFILAYAPEVRLDEQGRGYCPFHEDSHPSFGVHDERNFWSCYAGCGGGSLIDFWMKHRERRGEDGSFRATVKDLARLLL